MREDELIQKRMMDLSNKAYRNNVYSFSDFLNEMEYSELLLIKKELPISFTAFGGHEDADRMVVRFGSAEEFGYEEAFPIVCLEVRPANQRFADELSHRDLLGALMHLGIERSMLGDILVHENVGYVFCLEKMAPFIKEELCKVKHTLVNCKEVEHFPEDWSVKMEEKLVQAESERIDGVIAKVFRLSRSEVVELFRAKKIFVNAALEENNSRILKAEDVISVRGYGKFHYLGQQSVSKKGKRNLGIALYTR